MVRLGRELPSPMGGFANLHKAAASKGTLDTKTKELIALGIAVAIRCDLASRFTFMMRSRRALAAPRGRDARRCRHDGRRTGRHVCLRCFYRFGAVRERASLNRRHAALFAVCCAVLPGSKSGHCHKSCENKSDNNLHHGGVPFLRVEKSVNNKVKSRVKSFTNFRRNHVQDHRRKKGPQYSRPFGKDPLCNSIVGKYSKYRR